MAQAQWSLKMNHMLSEQELVDIAAHQSFILGCEDRTILLLLIRQLRFHYQSPGLETTFLGGNVLLTPQLAERIVQVLEQLKDK